MSHTLKLYEPMAQAIEALLHPYGEVVIHDLQRGRIHQIYNSLSRRAPGELSSLELNHEHLEEAQEVSLPYEKRNWDGRPMKSVTSLLKDPEGNAIGLLCINLDLSHFEGFHKFLKGFMERLRTPQAANDLILDNWEDRLFQFIQAYLQEKRLTLNTLTRDQKHQLIQHLEKRGAFKGKNAASLIGKYLNLSRATVYKYLSASTTSEEMKDTG